MNNQEEMRTAEQQYIHPLLVVDKLPAKRKIFIKNSFLQLGYQLGIQERKIIKTIFRMISPEDDDFKTYRIKVKDFMDITGLDDKSVYKMVKETLDSLWQLRIYAIEYDNKGNQGETEMQWLITKTYWPKLGLVDVSLHPKLKSYLLGIKKMKRGEGGFAVILPEELEGATCKHTERLYELLKAEWKNAKAEKSFDITLEYLRFYMGFDKQPGVYDEDAKYKLPADFKKRVLDDAIKEINSDRIFTLFRVECQSRKVGKKITYFTFTVTPRSEEEIQKFFMGGIDYDPEVDLDEDDIDLALGANNDVFTMLNVEINVIEPFKERLLKFNTTYDDLQKWAVAYYKEHKNDEIFFKLSNPLYIDTVLNEIEKISEDKIRISRKAVARAALTEGWGIPQNEYGNEQAIIRQDFETQKKAEEEIRSAQEEAAAQALSEENISKEQAIDDYLSALSQEEKRQLAMDCQEYLLAKFKETPALNFMGAKYDPDQFESAVSSKFIFRSYIADEVLQLAKDY